MENFKLYWTVNVKPLYKETELLHLVLEKAINSNIWNMCSGFHQWPVFIGELKRGGLINKKNCFLNSKA